MELFDAIIAFDRRSARCTARCPPRWGGWRCKLDPELLKGARFQTLKPKTRLKNCFSNLWFFQFLKTCAIDSACGFFTNLEINTMMKQLSNILVSM